MRVLEERGRRSDRSRLGPRDDTLAGVIGALRADGRFPLDTAEALARVRGLRLHPVLTAHPTEARRRTALQALRRIARILAARDDPRLDPVAARGLDDRLREELTILWRMAEARKGVPSPLDEVRTALVFFDTTLYSLAPAVQRSVREAIGLPAADVPAILRWGSWIGADRDGHPGVTAEITEHAARIQADHVLRGHQAVATRLMETVAAAVPADQLGRAVTARLIDDAETLPGARRDAPPALPAGAVSTPVRRHRRATPAHAPPSDRRPGPGHRALRDPGGPRRRSSPRSRICSLPRGSGRVAAGSIQDFRWQVETFGFHLAELEVRQHAAVHRAAADAVRVAGSMAASAILERRHRGTARASRPPANRPERPTSSAPA